MDQVISTGDAATDKEIVNEIKASLESSGMTVTITPAPGGGLHIHAALPQAVSAGPGLPAVELPKPGAWELGGTIGASLKSAALQGDLEPTLNYLRQARAEGRWNDYGFMVDFIGRRCDHSVIDTATARTNSPEARLLRAAACERMIWDIRGGGTGDTVSPEVYAQMDTLGTMALADLQHVWQTDAQNPTAPAMLIGFTALHSSLGLDDARTAFAEATRRHPASSLAYKGGLFATAQKWGGSHEEQLAVARSAIRHVGSCPDLYGALFFAHIEIWLYQAAFDGLKLKADAYFGNPQVQAELNPAFDAWVGPNYEAKLYSPGWLHWAAFWYDRVGDLPRLKRAIKAIGMVPCEKPWHYYGEPTMLWTMALQKAM